MVKRWSIKVYHILWRYEGNRCRIVIPSITYRKLVQRLERGSYKPLIIVQFYYFLPRTQSEVLRMAKSERVMSIRRERANPLTKAASQSLDKRRVLHVHFGTNLRMKGSIWDNTAMSSNRLGHRPFTSAMPGSSPAVVTSQKLLVS